MKLYLHALWIHIPRQFCKFFMKANSCERGESGLAADKRRLKYYTNRQTENDNQRSSLEAMVNDEWNKKKPLHGRIDSYCKSYRFRNAFVPNYIAGSIRIVEDNQGVYFYTSTDIAEISLMRDIQFEPVVDDIEVLASICKKSHNISSRIF